MLTFSSSSSQPLPFLLNLAVTEYCVLPIGSDDIRSSLDPDKNIKSILFYGPKGTGKTLAVEAVTHELGGLLIHLTPGDRYVISYHIISYHIISYHIISYHIISYHIISYHILSYHIISYHIISYHIISYHIISYHIIMSYHIMSYLIISYHIISYHILYHIISYHIMLYYIILYDCILYHIIESSFLLLISSYCLKMIPSDRDTQLLRDSFSMFHSQQCELDGSKWR